jgi:hypothetical protein
MNISEELVATIFRAEESNSSTLMVKAAGSSEMPVTTLYQAT